MAVDNVVAMSSWLLLPLKLLKHSNQISPHRAASEAWLRHFLVGKLPQAPNFSVEMPESCDRHSALVTAGPFPTFCKTGLCRGLHVHLRNCCWEKLLLLPFSKCSGQEPKYMPCCHVVNAMRKDLAGVRYVFSPAATPS